MQATEARSSTTEARTSTPTSRRCASAGGEAEDKQPIPGVGWFTRCKDTEGNPFGLFQSDESVHDAGRSAGSVTGLADRARGGRRPRGRRSGGGDVASWAGA